MKQYIFLLLLGLSVGAMAQTSPWQPVGPSLFPVDISGQINGIGRTTQVVFHPTDNQKMYAASASGGLWLSTDAGASWTVSGTDTQLPYTQCASVCVDYTNDQILYLGTGDPNYYSEGYGVYKSLDGGQTWSAATNGMGTRMAVDILMHPSNHLTLVAATNDGIFKTTDGGANWVEKFGSGDFTQMVYQPVTTGTPKIYAVTHSKFYYSTDWGDTWTLVNAGLTGSGGLADGCRIAVSAANPNVVYVGTVHDEGTIFKSTDAGLTFTNVYHNPAQSLTGYDTNGGGQGNYNFCIVANPLNANELFLGSHNIWRSTDGGVNWTQLTNWWEKVHTDMHQMLFSPYAPTTLLNVNDGGIWKTTNSGNTWTNYCDGLGATECYHAATSNATPQLVSIGTQDNGELYYYNGDWKTNRGGDWGARMWYDYVGNGRVYYDDGERRNTSNQGGAVSVNLPQSAMDAGDIHFGFTKNNTNRGVAGRDTLYYSSNLSQPANNVTWSMIQPSQNRVKDIKFTPDNPDVVYIISEGLQIFRCDMINAPNPVMVPLTAPASTNLTANITPLKNNTQIVFASCGSKVYRSADKGQTWVNYTGTLPPINILSLLYDENSNDSSLYLANAMGVYYRNASMSDWIPYDNGLPGIAQIVDLMMYTDGTTASKLRCAYYGRGVWEAALNSQSANVPYAAFSANALSTCINENVLYHDNSLGNPSSWFWTFQGGTPASSTQQHPTVSYATPGTYSVTLVVSNTNGTDTETKTGYITILSHVQQPLMEGFETGTFPPSNWRNLNIGDDNLFWREETGASGFGNSAKCTSIDNYSDNGNGSRDELWTAIYDFSQLDSPKLSFDVAYARYDNSYTDSLIVLVTTDCGNTFDRVWAKGDTMLATAPDIAAYFTPQANEWRKEEIDLSNYAGQSNVAIVFQNWAGYGNVLYLDNINLTADTVSSIVLLGPQSVRVFPVPTEGTLTLELDKVNSQYVEIQLWDLTGKKVLQQVQPTQSADFRQEIDLKHLAKGQYLLRILTEKGTFVQKIALR